MTQKLWSRLRWVPAAVLSALGLIGPAGCSYFVMDDFDSVQQVGRSWFPPTVACRFTYGQQAWVEHQQDWAYFLPAAFLLAAVLSVCYAARHQAVNPSLARPLWRHVLGISCYWFLAALTLAGLFAMLWSDAGIAALWPILTIPILSVWTLAWLWRTSGRPLRNHVPKYHPQPRPGWP